MSGTYDATIPIDDMLTIKRATFGQAEVPRAQWEEEIDQLVYELFPVGMIYGLTEDEVKILEGKMK